LSATTLISCPIPHTVGLYLNPFENAIGITFIYYRPAGVRANYKKARYREGEGGRDEIKSAYKKLAARYHPDKVNHLGDELKTLA